MFHCLSQRSSIISTRIPCAGGSAPIRSIRERFRHSIQLEAENEMKNLHISFAFLTLASCDSGLFEAPSSHDSARGDVAELQAVVAADLVAGPRATGMDVVVDAMAAVRAQRTALGLSDVDDDFELLSSDRGIDGIDHVRLQQRHRGVRVWGAD